MSERAVQRTKGVASRSLWCLCRVTRGEGGGLGRSANGWGGGGGLGGGGGEGLAEWAFRLFELLPEGPWCGDFHGGVLDGGYSRWAVSAVRASDPVKIVVCMPA